MNNQDYITLSLELHLFFDRIMKEHSFFIEAAFMEKDENGKNIAREFQNSFANILNRIVELANGNISENFLTSGEIVTKNTMTAESMSSNLTGINIDQNITLKELNLRSGNQNFSNQLLSSISSINKETLPLINQLITFKNNILNNVLSCKTFTTNYPLLIQHIMNEAKLYYELLGKIERREPITDEYIYQQELFWNNIMMEHAEFIRGLLDPSEKNLISTANNFANEYQSILNRRYAPNMLTDASLKETINFRNFKITGEEGILNCQIKSIIIPLLTDHVVREANHFIRLLQNHKKSNSR